MDVKIGELEDLFERYRSGQDLRALSKLFDLAAPELLRLSVHMAPDVASAEDLVQQTFLAAIEKPKRWRAGEPLLPWLFGILANLAKKQRRSMRRSPEPDRLAPRASEDPAHGALDAETHSAVRAALEGLPELYREVVRASLFDEKPPHQIAREFERAPGTVRMQLLRGLELLRRALPAGLAGGALVLCGTRGEAALKAVVLEKATGASVVLATSTLTLGGVLVSAKSLVAVLVAVVGLCTWLMWPGAPREGDVVGYEQDQYGYGYVVKADGHGGTHAERLPASQPERSRSAVEPAAPAQPEAATHPGIFLVGNLLGVAPEHVAEIELHVGLSRGSVDGKARADGSFELDLDRVGVETREQLGPLGLSIELTSPKPVPGESTQVEIWARHARYISEREIAVATDLFAPLAAGERREIRRDIKLRPAAVVTGLVRVPAGWKLEHADVLLSDDTPQRDFLDEVRAFEHSGCDAEGRYTIKSVRRGDLLVRAELPGLLPVAVYAKVEPGSVLELPDLVLEESGYAIRGRVDLPPDLLRSQIGFLVGEGVRISARRVEPPASAATLGALGGVVLDTQSARRERELHGGCVVSHQTCAIAEDQSFQMRGLEPGKWELSIDGILAHGTLPLFEKTIVEAPAVGVLLGEQLGSIAIKVVDSKGPVAGAGVTVGDGETFTTFTADKDGGILLVGDLRKDYTACASAAGRDKASLALPALARAREALFELRLSDAPQPATLVFRPTDAAGAPKSVSLRLASDASSDLGNRNELLRLANGRYELGGVLPGHWKITVGPSEEQMPVAFYGGYQRSERFETTLVPGERFERALRCEIGGRLRIEIEADASLKSNGLGCKLASLEGKPVEDPIFVSALSGEGFGIFGADEHLMIMGERTQVALQDCLPPGRYELRLTSDSVRAKPLVFEIKAGESTLTSWKIEK